MGGGLWGEWIHVCVWLSPFAIHLKLSQILKAIPPYKIKSLKFGKKRERNQSILSHKITIPSLYMAVKKKRNDETIKQPESNLMLLSSYILIIN
jgi:hypothetical protein